MVEQNSKTPDAPNDIPKNLFLGEDFDAWMRGSKEQKEFLEMKTHLDTHSKLADLRESFGQKSFEKGHTSLETNTPHLFRQNNADSSFETVQTRQDRDAKKNLFQGAAESIYTPFRALKDTFADAARMVFSPVQETKRTITYLEEESLAKIV